MVGNLRLLHNFPTLTWSKCSSNIHEVCSPALHELPYRDNEWGLMSQAHGLIFTECSGFMMHKHAGVTAPSTERCKLLCIPFQRQMPTKALFMNTDRQIIMFCTVISYWLIQEWCYDVLYIYQWSLSHIQIYECRMAPTVNTRHMYVQNKFNYYISAVKVE